jgi:hypothetical protein
MTLEGESYHKCFKCSHGGCILTTSSYATLNRILYCKIHFSQLFKEKGSYNHLIQTAQAKKSYMLLYANQQRHMSRISGMISYMLLLRSPFQYS